MKVKGVKGQDIHFCPEWRFNRDDMNRAAQEKYDQALRQFPGLRGLVDSRPPDDMVEALINEILGRLERKNYIKQVADRQSSRAKRTATLEVILASVVLALTNSSTNIDDVLMMPKRALSQHIGRQPWVCFFRKRGQYAGRPLERPFSQDVFIELVDAMTKDGLLESERATGQSSGAGLSSRFRATPDLIFLLAMFNAQPDFLEFARKPVVMKDENKKYVDLPKNDRRLTGIIERATTISNFVAGIDWAIIDPAGIDITNYVLEDMAAEARPRKDADENTQDILECCSKVNALAMRKRNRLYRVFNNYSLDHGGRFYGHAVQSILKAWRGCVVLNGQKTTILDFSSIHLHICYALLGLTPPTGDLYALKVKNFNREIAKKVCLIAINTANRKEALGALVKASKEEGWNLSTKQINSYIDAFIKKHQPIAKYFFSGFGTEAQNIDSRIAEKIMLKLIEQNVPCVPIHDGFIVPEHAREQLRAAMNESSMEVVGRLIPMKQEH